MALNFASTFLSLVSGKKQLSIPVTSGASVANAGQVVGLNSNGDIDVSMMPIGDGSLNLVPISGAVATLGLFLGGTPTAAT